MKNFKEKALLLLMLCLMVTACSKSSDEPITVESLEAKISVLQEEINLKDNRINKLISEIQSLEKKNSTTISDLKKEKLKEAELKEELFQKEKKYLNDAISELNNNLALVTNENNLLKETEKNRPIIKNVYADYWRMVSLILFLLMTLMSCLLFYILNKYRSAKLIMFENTQKEVLKNE